jgi:hypothetical protein
MRRRVSAWINQENFTFKQRLLRAAPEQIKAAKIA